MGEAGVENIVECRSRKHLKIYFDFCRRVDLRKVNRRVLESLIRSARWMVLLLSVPV
jgi:DNA polymerase-3 subunit alpha